jgi:hypothetical protein
MDAVGRTARAVTVRGRVLAVALLVMAACGNASAPQAVPTEADARTHLDSVVALVAAGEWERVCELGSGTCRQILREADPARVPASAPLVVATRVIEPAPAAEGGWWAGGRVLVLCGRDGLGEPYHSEMLVFNDGERLISTATPYWLGIGIAESPVVGGTRVPDPCP